METTDLQIRSYRSSAEFYMRQTVVEELVRVFEGYRMAPTPIDQFEQTGKDLLKQKLTRFVEQDKTIDFVMLGFPFKSVNSRDKVIGKIPDMAEEVTLKNFKAFNDAIKRHYDPGVNVHIVSDGYIFNDLLEVEDKTVAQYKEISMDMGREAPMKWYDLNDFYNSSSLKDKREKVIEHFGITDQKLEQDILFNPDVNYLYRGMSIFMEEELAIKEFPSRNQLHKAAKKLSREMMFRNEAYSNLVVKEFSAMIRLSMHPSVNNGTKYSFKLIPGEHTHYSAWHSALVIYENEQYMTMHKKDAIAAGYELMFRNDNPFYFKVK